MTRDSFYCDTLQAGDGKRRRVRCGRWVSVPILSFMKTDKDCLIILVGNDYLGGIVGQKSRRKTVKILGLKGFWGTNPL
jgi:hypothetical protein